MGTGNLLLDALPAQARQECMSKGTPVTLRRGEHLLRQGRPSSKSFFPVSALCSLTVELSSGDKVEAGIVGREGLVGLAFLDARGLCPFSALALASGEGYMVSQELLSSLIARVPEFRRAILIYSGYTLSGVGRAAACNAYHLIGQRLARWLLMMQDLIGADEFSLTHELLSQMLAATRPRVSLAAGRLRDARIIDYRRGTIRILDRARLEELACECYQTSRKDRQTLPWVGAGGVATAPSTRNLSASQSG